MTSDIREHLSHYLVLGGILLVGMSLFIWFREMPQVQQWIIGGTALGYILWGIIHHAHLKDLSFKIVMEYVLMGTLATLLVLAVLSQQ